MTAGLVDEKNQPYRNQHREVKEHEKVMLDLIEAAQPAGSLDVLDVGCADGLFLAAVGQRLTCATIHGVDNDPALVAKARERHYRAERSHVFLGDAGALMDEHPVPGLIRYDVIIASGILAFFEDQQRMIGGMCQYLKPGGCLFIFNKIIAADVDLRYSIRPAGGSWGEGRLVPSVATLTGAMRQHLREVTVQKFELPFDLAGTSNAHSTHTVRLADGSRMLVTNYNLVSELAFLYGRR